MASSTTNTAPFAIPSLAEPQRFRKLLNWAHLGYALPLLVLVASLSITFSLWKGAQQNARQELQSRFASIVRETNSHIGQRMEIYEQALRGVDGLFAHADSVRRNEFREYVARLKLEESYPGIHGLAFVSLVSEAAKDKHVAAIRKQGFPGYTIMPGGKREIYAAVTYIEPFNESNRRAFGYDMYSEPVRRAAMERARDSGHIAISGKVQLRMDAAGNQQAGFLMYLPVYKYDAPHKTLAERRANIIGWACAPFRAGDLMSGILGEWRNEVDVEIYDDEERSVKALMYDSDDNPDSRSSAAFQSVAHAEIGGHVWTVTIHSQPAFEALLDQGASSFIAYNGVGMSLLMVLLTWLLVHGRVQAIEMAQAMNKDLIKREGELRSLFDNASEGIWVIDDDKRTIKTNRTLLEILGVDEGGIIGKSIYDFLDRGAAGASQVSNIGQIKSGSRQYSEEELRRVDGRRIFCQFNTSRIYDEASGSTSLLALVTDITARKQLELQKEQYLKFFEFSLDMMCIIGADGFFKKVNPAFAKKMGYSEKEILEKPMTEILVADDQPASLAEVVEQVRGRVTQDFESRYLCAGGVFRWLSWRAFTDTADGLVYASARDITERKRFEEQLRQDKEKFHAIFEGSNDAVMLLTKEYFIDCNGRTLEMFGLAGKQEFASCHPADFSPPFQPDGRDSAAAANAQINLALERGSNRFEWMHRRKNGGDFLAEVLLSAFDYGGEQILQATVHDITERKRSDELLRKLFTAIEQSPVSVVITDTEGNIQYVNPQFTKATGYSAAEAIGRNPRMLQSGQTPRETYQDLWGKIGRGQTWHGEILNRRKNGENYWEEIHIAPVTDPAGAITHHVCLKTDITERMKSKAAIERISAFYKMLGDMNSANIHARDRDGLFEAACHIAVASGLFHMAWIGLLERESGDVLPMAQAGYVDGYLDDLHININQGERGDGPTAQAIKNGRHVACNDIANDPLMRPWRDEALARGYRALIVFPLYQNGEVTGSFNLYFRETNLLTADIIQLLDSLVADISFTLDFMAESLERERAQNEMRELSLFLETAREDERKHLARELHDELGQTMTALRFDLNWMGDNLQAEREVVGGKIQAMKEVVSQTVDAIRRISEDLRPGMLDDLGLAAAIENHVTKFAKRTGITCDLVLGPEDFDMDEQVATALFRIVQESLTNVARHSGADLASIQLHELKDNVFLVVQDNGRGLPPAPNTDRKTFGLLGMRERVKMLGGTLDIFSEPGAGVRIEASISKHAKRNL